MKKKDLFRATKKRIMFSSVLIVLGALLIFALITQMVYKRTIYTNIDQQLQSQKNMILRAPNLIKHKGDEEEIIMPAPLVTNLISLVFKDGELVDEGPHEYQGKEAYPKFPDNYKFEEIITIEDAGYTYRAVALEKEGLWIELLINIERELATVEDLEKALCLAFLLLVLIALAMASYIATIALKPLHRSYDKQAAFVQDASHEMRTPLAIIRGKLELMARASKDPIEAHYDEIASMMSELRGLEKLNRDLLLMSKEDMEGSVELAEFSLNDLLEELGGLYGEFAELQDKVFSLNKLDIDKEVRWDEVKVKRCLSILLDNALKYTSEGAQITLSAKKAERAILLSVADTGIGIKEEDQKRLFDRFFRSDEVRARGIEGSGIGLSLLQSLCHTLNIKITVQSEYGRGTTFVLKVPF